MAIMNPIPALKKINWKPVGGVGLLGGGIGLFGGPAGALIGAVVGGVVGLALGKTIVAEVQKIIPPSAMQSPGEPTVHQTVADQVADTGLAKPAATALYAYLKVHGPDGSPDLGGLLTTFQNISNTDPQATALTGGLPVTGVYDVKTSAALTLYTHDPIPPATPPAIQPPPTPAQIANVFLPGAAANSGFNLHQYLKVHGNSRTDGSLQKLVHQFQIDVNSDPKYPGPAALPPMIMLVKTRLTEDGIYGPAVAAALTIMSDDPIKP
jgi:hypothetical protein